MRIVCWQTILMKYHTLLGKMSQYLSSAAVVIGALSIMQRVQLTQLLPQSRSLLDSYLKPQT